MKNYGAAVSRKMTPQTELIPGRTDQAQNEAGGYVFRADAFDVMRRFLILGTEGGTYYVDEQKLTRDMAAITEKCIGENGTEAVRLIVEVSGNGLAMKNDPAIFALALAASAKSDGTRREALKALPLVCRIPTYLFHFAEYVQHLRGWGRGLARAVAGYYTDTKLEDLAYQMVKYQQRDGWSHSDLIRLSHPRPVTGDAARHALLRWGRRGSADAYTVQLEGRTLERPALEVALPDIVRRRDAAHAAMAAGDKDALCKLARELPREALPTEALALPEVWDALLDGMPLGALLRNLGNLSKHGILKPLGGHTREVCQRLTDREALKKARIHPLAVLVAKVTYASGGGLKGGGAWDAVPKVVEALEDAFVLSFDAVEPSGKRVVYALDVSGSMSAIVHGLQAPISCRDAGAVMCLVNFRTEPDSVVLQFSADCSRVGPLPFTRHTTLAEAQAIVRQLGGGTDCALPLQWMLRENIEADALVYYTDSETWAGHQHAVQALEEYRRKYNPALKVVVVAMSVNEWSIVDEDPRHMTVVGFDASAPAAINAFIGG